MTQVPRPFVKWAGGKGQLLYDLLEHAPRNFGAYYEPFAGGAALFFALHRHDLLDRSCRIVLSDMNKELTDTMIALRDEVGAVIGELKKHVYDKDHYYEVRALNPDDLELDARAARFIYLNRSCFNGLYRVNKSGKFNVPFGKYTNPTICDEANLRAVSMALHEVEIWCASYEDVVGGVGHSRSCFIYFDPPYAPASPTANFTSYTPGGFGMDAQEKLAQMFDDLAEQGVRVMMTNADVPWVRDRYKEHRLIRAITDRNISAKKDTRTAGAAELIIVPR